jgi:hypothetical protein
MATKLGLSNVGGGSVGGLLLLYSPECVEVEFSEVRVVAFSEVALSS